jgi:tRNA dimethylallyltransferase
LHPLVVILGPTATGKTKIAVDLALKIGGEIISGDSMQVYRYMDIGTAKIKPAETKGIPHHLLNLKNPDEFFSVAEFQKLAREKIAEIADQGKIPFLVGGTGLYIQAVIDPYEFTEQGNLQPYRHQLFLLTQERGEDYLHTLLSEVDPAAARKIHPHDLKRVRRALEYYHLTGKPISDNRKAVAEKGQGKTSQYNLVLIGLTMQRALLYQKIEQRVEEMMEAGFLEEVQSLLLQGYAPELPAMQGLGYKQLASYLGGEGNLFEAINLIKKETRHFAKRQMTWFKRDPRIKWFAVDNIKSNYAEILKEMLLAIGRTIRT